MKTAAEQRHLRLKRGDSLLNRFLDLLSSVRFGIFLLIILILLSSMGMVVMQQNIDGFDRYIAAMPEERRLLFATLGLFDIYRSWYFTATIILLSVNIVLASIERLPLALRYLRKPKTRAGESWLASRTLVRGLTTTRNSEKTLELVKQLLPKWFGKSISISGDSSRQLIFAEKGVTSRLGAYAVHVSLLVIFTGGFLTANFSYSGKMNLSPGINSNQIIESAYQIEGMTQARRTLPFDVICTDIEQKLVRRSGGLDNGNTIDWITRFVIDDDDGKFPAAVSMNRPFDYQGYRFFQSSYVEIPRARWIEVSVSRDGVPTETVRINRDGSARLVGGEELLFTGFNADGGFRDSGVETADISYPDPIAVLRLTDSEGELKSVIASRRGDPVEGIGRLQLLDFEKVSETHILSIQYDPGAGVVYLGFLLLGLSLVWVFTSSHERIWVSIRPNDTGCQVLIGGDSNRHSNRIRKAIHELSTRLEN